MSSKNECAYVDIALKITLSSDDLDNFVSSTLTNQIYNAFKTKQFYRTVGQQFLPCFPANVLFSYT